jgi:hypothetical protein
MRGFFELPVIRLYPSGDRFPYAFGDLRALMVHVAMEFVPRAFGVK